MSFLMFFKPKNNKLKNAGQPAYFGASVRECELDKKMRANPARCGTLDRSGYHQSQVVLSNCATLEMEIFHSRMYVISKRLVTPYPTIHARFYHLVCNSKCTSFRRDLKGKFVDLEKGGI